ncbi:MAG: lipopolysaccharide heptosyltransferase II [Chloroflexota bacterium]|nr:lipopolysaccharide heptosyltransferase II [Chloroflexota bacterium]
MVADERWNQAKKLLCVRLDTIGDVMMTTPAIRALKESGPGRHITLLTSSPGAMVAPYVPEVDNVIVYDAPWINVAAPRKSSQPEVEMAEQLREAGFDAAVIFTVYSQNPLPAAFLCYLADIPLRLAHCHENPYQLLNPWVEDPEPTHFVRHEVRRHLDLVATVGCQIEDERMSFQVPAAARQRIQQLLEGLAVDLASPWVVIHPGATAPSRRYPPEGFAAVADRLVMESNWQVLFTGTSPERELVEEIQSKMNAPSHSLVGCLSLAELGALLEAAPVLISNNSGPVHIAAALGTPIVDLYALTNLQHTPWMVPSRVLYHDVPCKLCYRSICPEGHHHCLRLVSPDAVVTAAHQLLEQSRHNGAGEMQELADIFPSVPFIFSSGLEKKVVL